MTETIKYDVLEREIDFLNEKKQTVIDDISECFDKDEIGIYEDLQEEVNSGLKVPKAYDEAIDIFYDYISDGTIYSTDEAIADVEKQEEVISNIKRKIEKISNIIELIEKDFVIKNIETSHGSVSTYLTVKYSKEFDLKFSKKKDFDYDREYDSDTDSDDISVRISDHYVGGNEFSNYPHSEYEWLI